MTAADRKAATLDFLRGGKDEGEREQRRAWAASALARARGFREKRVRGMPEGKLAELLAQRPKLAPKLTLMLLHSFVTTSLRDEWLRFLDALGVEHDDEGTVRQDLKEPPDGGAAAKALSVLDESSDESADLLLHWAELVCPVAAVPVRQALRERSEEEVDVEEPEDSTEGAEDEHPEEGALGFTTLDRVLIRSTVDAIAGVEGAFDDDQIEDLIEEVVHLNGHRHSSYFHSGFLDGLRGRPPLLEFAEANRSRQGWYLSGYLAARARKGRAADLLALFEEHRALVTQALTPQPFSGMALPFAVALIEAFLEEGREGEIAELFHPGVFAHAGPRAWRPCLDRATDLLLKGRPEEAQPLLELLQRLWHPLDGVPEWQPPPPRFRLDVQRRLGQTARMLGDFDRAQAILTKLEGQGNRSFQARIAADLGLVDCALKALSSLRLPQSEDGCEALQQKLVPGEQRFQQAMEFGGAAGNAAFCLAMLAMARGEPEGTQAYARKALAEFKRNPHLYSKTGVLDRTRLLLGWASSKGETNTEAHDTVEEVQTAILGLGREAAFLALQALENVLLVDVDCAVRLAESLLQAWRDDETLGDRVFELLDQSSATYSRSENLRPRLLERARKSGRSDAERAADLARLVVIADRKNDEALAAEVLSEWQGLAMADPRSQVADAFLAALRGQSDGAPDTGWSAEEIRDARVALHLGRGEREEAAALLDQTLVAALNGSDPWSLTEAEDVLQLMEPLGVAGCPSPDRLEWLAARKRTGEREVLPADTEDLRARILFVGGNETQERYEASIRDTLAKEYPNVEVVFEFTGWGANWGRDKDRIHNEIGRSNAVVLMRFVRTNLGRAVRRSCNELGRDWIPCTGHGRGSILSAIRQAIRVAAKAKTSTPC